MNLRVLSVALDEAEHAAQWYDEQEAGLGSEFLNELEVAGQNIFSHPRRYAKVEGVAATRNVRRYLLRRFPYKIVYEVRDDEIVVLAVAHLRRRPFYWRRRKGRDS